MRALTYPSATLPEYFKTFKGENQYSLLGGTPKAHNCCSERPLHVIRHRHRHPLRQSPNAPSGNADPMETVRITLFLTIEFFFSMPETGRHPAPAHWDVIRLRLYQARERQRVIDPADLEAIYLAADRPVSCRVVSAATAR